LNFKYIFGPVHSRRLNLSLGIDLFEKKTCTYDCIYCECGKTSVLTLEPVTFPEKTLILKELELFLKQNPCLDFITFSGKGEPTLYKNFYDIAKFLKQMFPEFPLALLTNGSLLYKEEIQEALNFIDVICPTLTTIDENLFKKIHRPHTSYKLDCLIKGLETTVKKFKNKVWLEIFILKNLNDDLMHLTRLSKFVNNLKPAKVQINSVDRPPADDIAISPERNSLFKIANLFENSELLVYKDLSKKIKITKNIKEKILSLISRRPSTDKDIMEVFNIEKTLLDKYLKELLAQKKIKISSCKRGIFYILNKNSCEGNNA